MYKYSFHKHIDKQQDVHRAVVWLFSIKLLHYSAAPNHCATNPKQHSGVLLLFLFFFPVENVHYETSCSVISCTHFLLIQNS